MGSTGISEGPEEISSSTELTKNAKIQVTIDEISDGLVVVSFSNNDNLYQGVLLQLSRDRGIPAGISYPIAGVEPPPEPPTPDVDPPPISQRYTYAQNQGSGLSPPDTKSGISLRRVIKTPARFKNARTSVRLRCRPVLCARCSDLCEDKGSPTTGRRNSPIEKPNKPDERTIPPKPEKEIDYSYISIGKSDIVDNYWQRPMSQSVASKPSAPKKSKQPNSQSTSRETRKHTMKLGTTLTSRAHTPHEQQNKAEQHLKNTSTPIGTSMVRKSKRKGYPLHANSNSSKCLKFSSDPRKTRQKNRKTESVIVSHAHNNNNNGTDPLAASSWENSSSSSTNSKTELHTYPHHQDCRNRIRKKSRVRVEPPLRRWRPSSEDEHCSSSPDLSTETTLDTIAHLDRSHMACNASTGSCSSFSNSFTNSSPEDVSTTTTTNGGDRVDPTKPKTPVIKITFGSSGNGVVVQIPPKDTNIETDTPTSMDSKSCRKAMKKAKKEARRKKSSLFATSTIESSSVSINNSSNSTPMVGADTTTTTSTFGVASSATFRSQESSRAKENFKTKEHKRRRKESGSKSRFMQNIQPDELIDSSTTLPHNECSSTTSGPLGDIVESFSTSGGERSAENRVCISLKRLDSNAYVPVNKVSSTLESRPKEPGECYGIDPSDESSSNSRIDGENLEPIDMTTETPCEEDEFDTSKAISIATYEDDREDLDKPHVYKRGDIVWGKLPGSPWWPAKILDVLVASSGMVRAKVEWYKASGSTCLQFSKMAPFTGYFNRKYEKDRILGLYQEAVQDASAAIEEAHNWNTQDLPKEGLISLAP